MTASSEESIFCGAPCDIVNQICRDVTTLVFVRVLSYESVRTIGSLTAATTGKGCVRGPSDATMLQPTADFSAGRCNTTGGFALCFAYLLVVLERPLAPATASMSGETVRAPHILQMHALDANTSLRSTFNRACVQLQQSSTTPHMPERPPLGWPACFHPAACPPPCDCCPPIRTCCSIHSSSMFSSSYVYKNLYVHTGRRRGVCICVCMRLRSEPREPATAAAKQRAVEDRH